MINFRETIRNIATISPSSIGVLIIIGGWEPIYQLLLLFKVVNSTFSGFFITLGIILSQRLKISPEILDHYTWQYSSASK